MMEMKYRLWVLFVVFADGPLGVRASESGCRTQWGWRQRTAHIGALKVIEEAGIPIDYVVGTSMGAIVGGLYSIGYTRSNWTVW